MAVARTRYNDAQTVSDEHGKGAEILRQQVADHWEASSAVASVSSNHHIMYCEVDIIIRYMRVMTVDVPDANADLTIYRNRAGTITALTAAARAFDALTTEIIVEETILASLGNNAVIQDDTVYAIMVRDATSSESGDWAVYFGWMPNIFEPNAVLQTY